MSYRDLQKRLEALEQAHVPADDGERFVVDIGGDGPARYWIDGCEVSADEYARRVPAGPYYVDLGTMMSYSRMERRLADLEQAAAAKQQVWVESLSDEELVRYVADYAGRDPVGYAAFEAMSDEELDRACDGRMSEAEWQQHVQRAQERITAMIYTALGLTVLDGPAHKAESRRFVAREKDARMRP